MLLILILLFILTGTKRIATATSPPSCTSPSEPGEVVTREVQTVMYGVRNVTMKAQYDVTEQGVRWWMLRDEYKNFNVSVCNGGSVIFGRLSNGPPVMSNATRWDHFFKSYRRPGRIDLLTHDLPRFHLDVMHGMMSTSHYFQDVLGMDFGPYTTAACYAVGGTGTDDATAHPSTHNIAIPRPPHYPGNVIYRPQAAVDIVAHELTHLYVESNAWAGSNAHDKDSLFAEGLGDVFGIAVKAHYNGTHSSPRWSWWFGEDSYVGRPKQGIRHVGEEVPNAVGSTTWNASAGQKYKRGNLLGAMYKALSVGRMGFVNELGHSCTMEGVGVDMAAQLVFNGTLVLLERNVPFDVRGVRTAILEGTDDLILRDAVDQAWACVSVTTDHVVTTVSSAYTNGPGVVWYAVLWLCLVVAVGL